MLPDGLDQLPQGEMLFTVILRGVEGYWKGALKFLRGVLGFLKGGLEIYQGEFWGFWRVFLECAWAAV